ncbi:hypothetical protein GCM10009092_30650 [Bowmanella denitrificans]|uniref:RND efflux pump membrane fusion protein barrel-sandwich domain-containing protein n=1 Tax=Bowmanella denitrificans TaxID=366582 RepID=A0ABN0XHQ6_9ALTE
MRKVVFSVVGLTLFVGGWYWLGGEARSASVHYQTQAVSRGTLQSLVNTSGTLQAVVTVDVGSELSGQIVELLADFNSQVEKGQIIARLDDRTVKAKLRQAEADILMAQASISQQQASLQKAEAEGRRARRALQRAQQLFQQQLSNDNDLDQAKLDQEVAEAQIQLASAQVTSAQAQLAQRQAQKEQIELDLTRTLIRSPVSGTVISREVDVGQTVAASLSAPVLFTIAQDLSQMQIEADVDEADIGRIAEGQAVRFTVDTYPERQFSGRVSQVRKAANLVSNVVTYKVIVEAPNRREALLPGMTANLDIVLGERTDVLRLPNAALRFKPKGTSLAPQPSETRQMPDWVAQLQLSGEQAKQVRALQESTRDNMRALRQQMAGGPSPGGVNPMQQQRQAFQNKLKSLLSEEQFTRYQALNREQRSTRNSSASVWVLSENGQPEERKILIGLENNDYTELLGEQLADGTQLIIRAQYGE